jgi:hypothetical protein
VKSVGEEAPGAVEIDAALGQVDGPRPGDSLGDQVLRAAEVGKIADVFGKRLGVHGVCPLFSWTRAGRGCSSLIGAKRRGVKTGGAG